MQLESAMKASERGGSLLAVCGSEAIVLLTLPAADRITRLILPPRSVRCLARGIGVAPVGITSDTTFLVDKCFEMVVSNSKTYDRKPSVRRVVTAVAEFMHDRTQDMASRPFGASLCLFGVTSSEPELFEVTPSGACTQKRVVGLGKLHSLDRRSLAI
jgi:20S proteasome alpha/beta subunit